MRLRTHFHSFLDGIRNEERYRIFTNLERHADRPPYATWHKDGTCRKVVVWCSAEDHYMQAFGWARQQQALSWGTACRYEPRPAVAPARPGRRSGRAPFFSLQSVQRGL